LRRFHETGEYSRRPGQRRRRTTTAQRDRFLLLQSLRHRTLTAPALQVMTLGRYQFQISANTVRRRLAEHDLRPRIPARGPQLTAAHRRVRLLFTQNHVDWELDQWRLVMFSDESRFCLDQSDRRVRVNQCSGERYAQCNIIRKVNFGRDGLSRCHFRRSHRVGGARKRNPKCGDVHYQYSGTSTSNLQPFIGMTLFLCMIMVDRTLRE
jgi:hypothetical protein